MNENIEEADLKERLEGFNNELKAILGKYELGVAALPKVMPNGTLGADPIIVSVRSKAKVEEPTSEAITE